MILCLQITDSVVKVYSMCGLLHLSFYCFHFILYNPLRVDSKYDWKLELDFMFILGGEFIRNGFFLFISGGKLTRIMYFFLV